MQGMLAAESKRRAERQDGISATDIFVWRFATNQRPFVA
jgi:hypothetical protein